MCRVFNTIGSLSDIQVKLVRNDIDNFTSLQELLNFENEYQSLKEALILEHSKIVEDEKLHLNNEINLILENHRQREDEFISSRNKRLDNLYNTIFTSAEPEKSMIPIIRDYWQHFILWSKIVCVRLDLKTRKPILHKSAKANISNYQERISYINQYFDSAVSESYSVPMDKLDRKREVVHSTRNSVFGAEGEYEVEKVLRELPDNNILINNFTYSFRSALYYRQKNEHILSIQIDHILISTNGIYVIETKNWSKNSLFNDSFLSPIDQIKRSNFALYVILSNAISRSNIKLDKHRWGTKKLPLRNLVVFTRAKPKQDFEFVKVLGLSELLSYVGHFNPVLFQSEVEAIAEYLTSVTDAVNITSKLRM